MNFKASSLLNWVCAVAMFILLIDILPSEPRMATAEARFTTDTARVLGHTMPLDIGFIVYPIFLENIKVHTWLDASKVKRPLHEGEVLAVEYNKDELLARPYLMYHVKPISP